MTDDEQASIELASIEGDYPGWKPWRSDGGRWWATRIGARLPESPPEWWAMTVYGETADGLRDALEVQVKSAAGRLFAIGNRR